MSTECLAHCGSRRRGISKDIYRSMLLGRRSRGRAKASLVKSPPKNFATTYFVKRVDLAVEVGDDILSPLTGKTLVTLDPL